MRDITIMAMKRQHVDEKQINVEDDVQYNVDDLLVDLNVAGRKLCWG